MNRSKIIKWFLFIINIVLIILAYLFYRSIFSYLVVGFVFAYLLGPVVDYAERYKISRTISILGIYFIIGLVIFLLINAFIPVLIKQYQGFKDMITTLLNSSEELKLENIGLGKISEYLEKISQRFPELRLEEKINSFIDKDKINNLLNQIPSFFIGIFSLISFMIVVPVVTFFLLKDERKFIKTIFTHIPNRYFEFAIHLFEEIEDSFGRFFRALLIETVLVAGMSIIGLVILQIPYALLLGLIVGIANPIKYFGPFIGAVPTLLVILIGNTPDIYLIHASLLFLVVQQIDSLILFPWLVGKSIDIHPLWVLLTVLAGGYAFGLLGMLLSVPVVFLIKLIYEVSLQSLRDFEII